MRLQLLLSAGIIGTATAQETICRALVMSGGANKGAYEAGVLWGLSHMLNNSDAHYDVVSGVSAGALNAAAISMFPPHEAIRMSDGLVDFWITQTTNMICQMLP